jgi:hypothetical protein
MARLLMLVSYMLVCKSNATTRKATGKRFKIKVHSLDMLIEI